jgi:DNA repair exonuclease SbcCD ATPase subunit
MIRLTHLRVNGFKQLRDINLTFPTRCCVLIEGLNEAGKSALFEAIYTALYGRGLVMRGGGRGQMDSLIGVGLAEAFVELGLTSGDVRLRIERHLHRGRANDGRLFIESLDGSIEQVRGVTRVNEEILVQLRDLDSEALLHSCFVQQKKLGQLEEVGRDRRQAILLKLLDLDRLTQLKERFAWRSREEFGLKTARDRQRLAELARCRMEAELECQTIQRQLRLVDIHEALDEADRKNALSEQLWKQMQEQVSLRDRFNEQISYIEALDTAAGLLERIREGCESIRKRTEDILAIDRELSEFDRIQGEILPARRAESRDLAALSERLANLVELETALKEWQARQGSLQALIAEAEALEKPRQGLASLRSDLAAAQRDRDRARGLRELGKKVEGLLTQIGESESTIHAEVARGARLTELTEQAGVLATSRAKLVAKENLLAAAQARASDTTTHYQRAQQVQALRRWVEASRGLEARRGSEETIRVYAAKASETRERAGFYGERVTSSTRLITISALLLPVGLAILLLMRGPVGSTLGGLLAIVGLIGVLLLQPRRQQAVAARDAALNEADDYARQARDERIRQETLLGKEVPDLEECRARLQALGLNEPEGIVPTETLIAQTEKDLRGGWTTEGLSDALEQAREEVRQLEIEVTKIREYISAEERRINSELQREGVSNPSTVQAVIGQIEADICKLQADRDGLKRKADELMSRLPSDWNVANLEREAEAAENSAHNLDIQVARLAEHVTNREHGIAQGLADEGLEDIQAARAAKDESDKKISVLHDRIGQVWDAEVDTLNRYSLPHDATAARQQVENRLSALSQEISDLERRLGQRVARQDDRERLLGEINDHEQRTAGWYKELETLAIAAQLTTRPANTEAENALLKAIQAERAKYDLSQIKSKRDQAAAAASRAEAGAIRAEEERASRLGAASDILHEFGIKDQNLVNRYAIGQMFPDFGVLATSDREWLGKQNIEIVAQLRSYSDQSQELGRELHISGANLDEAACIAEVESLELRKAICQRATPILDRVRDNILQAVLPSTLDYMRMMLPLLTAGRYHDAELDEETYKIRVWDAQAREYVEKDIYSGATQDQFSLALRLGFALAALPQERGARPGFIFLDEPTAGFDAQRRGALVELLTQGELAEHFDQIFLVAPEGAFPENPFPHHIQLVEGRVAAENLSQEIST